MITLKHQWSQNWQHYQFHYSFYFWRTVRSTTRSRDSNITFHSESLEPFHRELGMSVAKKQEIVTLSTVWERLQLPLRGQTIRATNVKRVK